MKSSNASEVAKRVLLITLAVVVVVLGYAAWVEGSSNRQPTQIQETQKQAYVPDDMDLYIQAQQFVLQSLKAPSTAKFPAVSYEAKSLGDGFYRVSSYVDSQNSFGAMLRSDWTVDMALIENHWFLDKMTVDGKVVYDATKSD